MDASALAIAFKKAMSPQATEEELQEASPRPRRSDGLVSTVIQSALEEDLKRQTLCKDHKAQTEEKAVKVSHHGSEASSATNDEVDADASKQKEMIQNAFQQLQSLPHTTSSSTSLHGPGAYAVRSVRRRNSVPYGPNGTMPARDRQHEGPNVNSTDRNTTTGTINVSGDPDLIQARAITSEEAGIPDCDIERAVPVYRDGDDASSEASGSLHVRLKGLPNRCLDRGVFLLLPIAIAMLLVLGLSSNSSSEQGAAQFKSQSQEDISDTLFKTSEAKFLKTLLAPQTLKTISNDVLTPTPQGLALRWLVEDPNFHSYTPSRLMQRFGLATLFYSTQGPKWKNNLNWLSYSHHECDWWAGNTFSDFDLWDKADSPCGTTTSGTAHNMSLYQRLWLPSNKLQGSLPEEVFLCLSNLQSIDLFGNFNLTGTLSTNMHQLANLKKFGAAWTGLAGTLPTQIGLVSSLQVLYLDRKNKGVVTESNPSGTLFHGQLPSQLGLLTSLQELTLSRHLFSGQVPSELGNLSALYRLLLQDNNLQGSLPTEIGRMQGLRWAFLYANHFSGSLMSEVGMLPQLSLFHAYQNHLSGSIPSELGLLTVLKDLMLANNSFTGVVPVSALEHNRNLEILFLSHNPDLQGTIPSNSSLLTSLEVLDVNETAIEFVTVAEDPPLDTSQKPLNFSFWDYNFKCQRRYPCKVRYA